MKDLLKLLRFLLRPSAEGRSARGHLALALLAGGLSGAASAGLLIEINRALSRANNLTMGLVWSFLGLCVVLPVTRFASQVLLARLSQSTLLDLRLSFARRLLGAPLRRLEQIGPHRILTTLTDDSATLREVLGNLPLLFMQFTVVAVCLLYLAWISVRLLLVVLCVLAVGVVTYRLAMLQAIPFYRRAQAGSERLMRIFRGLTDGTKELKLHRPRRLAFLRQLLELTVSIQRDNLSATTINAAANSWGQILSFLLTAILFYMSVAGMGVSRETLTGTVLVILYMRTPVDVLLQMMPALGRGTIAMQRIREVGVMLDEAEAESDDAALSEAPPDWRRLELAGVTHAYRREGEDTSFELGPVDLLIEPGELIFVVGGNGSGKTTLAKLILGLYAPESGEVLFDGLAVNEASRDRYRSYFTGVFSDFFLFDTLLGLERHPELDTQARIYLEKLHLGGKVQVRDGELSTTALSQGQRKRLALLTGYLEDRPIYLFDEWAADQDPYFKEIFYLELLPELKARRKTIIVISHDDRYYNVADRIVKLENGRVKYQGPINGYVDTLSSEALESPLARHS